MLKRFFGVLATVFIFNASNCIAQVVTDEAGRRVRDGLNRLELIEND